MPTVPSPPRGLTDAEPFPPDCAERFAHVRCIARGGFGAVHQAIDRRTRRAVAIKLLLADLLRDPDQVVRFRNEAQITAALAHPNVVAVIDSGAGYQIPWIAYEYLPGKSVRAVLDDARGRLPYGQALEVARQVACALEAAHARGVLHRDIKPDNVLTADDSSFKVTDFGIAKWAAEGAVKTRTGLVMGTPTYVSPEQIEGYPATAASDIYSLGVMLYELLTGRPPFEDASALTVLERHLNSAVPLASARRPELPAAADAVLARALAKRPAERFASAADLREALEKLQAGAGEVAAPAGLASRPGLRRGSGRTRAIGPTSTVASPVVQRPWRSALAAAGVAALLVALALRPGPTPVAPPSPSATPSPAAEAPPDPSRLLAEASRLRGSIGGIDDRRVEAAEFVLNPAASVPAARHNLDDMASEVERLCQLVLALERTDGPWLLSMEPRLEGTLRCIGRTIRELEMMPERERALRETRLGPALDHLRAALQRLPDTAYGRALRTSLAADVEFLNVDRLNGFWRASADAALAGERLVAAIEDRDGPGYWTAVGRCMLLWRAADDLSSHRREATVAVEEGAIRRRLDQRVAPLFAVLGVDGSPATELGQYRVNTFPGLSDTISSLMLSAFEQAGTDVESDPAGVLRLALSVTHAAGDWWWCDHLVGSEPWAEVDNVVARRHVVLDEDSRRDLEELRANRGIIIAIAALDGADAGADLVATALRQVGQMVPVEGLTRRQLGLRVLALERISDRLDVMQHRTHDPRFPALGATYVEHVAETVRVAGRAGLPLTAAARAQLARVIEHALLAFPAKDFAQPIRKLEAAIAAWAEATPSQREARWAQAAVILARGDRADALARYAALLDDMYRELAPRLADSRSAVPATDEWLCLINTCAGLLQLTPDRAVARRLLERDREIAAHSPCGASGAAVLLENASR